MSVPGRQQIHNTCLCGVMVERAQEPRRLWLIWLHLQRWVQDWQRQVAQLLEQKWALLCSWSRFPWSSAFQVRHIPSGANSGFYWIAPSIRSSHLLLLQQRKGYLLSSTLHFLAPRPHCWQAFSWWLTFAVANCTQLTQQALASESLCHTHMLIFKVPEWL